MLTVYGIRNCDTVQRALGRLAEAGILHRFHDFKMEGLSATKAQAWIDALGADTVINRKGSTWRRLDAAIQDGVTAANAAALLAREPSLVKRPVFEREGRALAVGFPKGGEEALIAKLLQGRTPG